MDPGTGRRWPTCAQFLSELYVHTMPIPAAAWRAWAGSDECLGALHRRLAHRGLSGRTTTHLLDAAIKDPAWRPLATLDAAMRLVDTIICAGGLHHGRPAARALMACLAQAQHAAEESTPTIPATCWSVQPAPPGPEGEEQLLLRGAVLVRISGQRPGDPGRAPDGVSDSANGPASLSPELAAALAEPPHRPGREILRLLHADGLLSPIVLVAALVLAATGLVIEGLLWRGLVDLGHDLALTGQRLGAMGVLLIFTTALLLLDLCIAAGVLRYGRRLEVRLRLAFLEKLPRLGDRYFHSRLVSDMAERLHSLYRIRLLPELGGQLVLLSCELILTAAGIAWLDPASTPVAVLAAALAIGLPLIAQPVLAERDFRVRTHVRALSRFYLDALFGLVAIRTHRAESAVRREHETLLGEWAHANLGLLRTVVTVEGMQILAGFGLAAWLLLDYRARGGEASVVLLLIYWVLNLPVLGQELALLARQYPTHCNVTLRLLEPLGALEEEQDNDWNVATHAAYTPRAASSHGVALAFQGVSIRVAGRPPDSVGGPTARGSGPPFSSLTGIAIVPDGRLLVVDEFFQWVLEVDPNNGNRTLISQ